MSRRNTPAQPTVTKLASGAGSLMASLVCILTGLAVGFVVLLVLSFKKSKSVTLAAAPRIVGIVLVIACAFGANQLWYADKARYDAYPTVDNPYFQVNQYNTRGMIYSFLHQFNITQMEAPEGYDATYFAEKENKLYLQCLWSRF